MNYEKAKTNGFDVYVTYLPFAVENFTSFLSSVLYLSTTMALRKSVILVAVLLCVGCFAQFDDYPSGARRLPGMSAKILGWR